MKKNLFILSVIISLLLLNVPLSWTAHKAENDKLERAERISEEERGKILTPSQQLLQLLKERALLKTKEKRGELLKKTKGTVGLHLAYDNNVYVDSERLGDTYIQQYFSFFWTPVFNKYLSAEVGPWIYSNWYFDMRDTTITDYACKGLLKIFPKGTPNFELQPGGEIQYIRYPYDERDSFIENKGFLKAKHRFWKSWSQEAKYEYAYKEYKKRAPRSSDTDSTSDIGGMSLEKNRHTFEYILGFPIGKNNFKLKQRVYKETSNDHYRNYYDLFAYRITPELGRRLTEKLYGKISFEFERKNHRGRRVTNYDVERYDDLYTSTLDFYYTLKKDWTLTYSLSHKKSDSNQALADYDKITHIIGLYVNF